MNIINMKRFFKCILKKMQIHRLVKYLKRKRIIKLYNLNKYNKILSMKVNRLALLKDKDVKKFLEIKNKIENINIKNLQKKDKIKVGFIIYTASMWSCDKLYKMMWKSSIYQPYIIVARFNDGTEEARKENYNITLKYFSEKKYNIVDGDDVDKVYSMDVIIYLNPFGVLPGNINITELPLRILTIYITYSFMLVKREQNFRLPAYQLTWKYFTDTPYYKEMVKEKSITGDSNVVSCGFIRMDEFYNKNVIDESKIWKISKNAKNKVYKIIYAPHHSVFNEDVGFSTFDKNYKFMLELAKKYQDNTSWIIKPHPLLKGRIVEYGFFEKTEDYDNYLKEWDNLPNAKVATDGTYFDIFKSSDCMILDSVSFLAEYQYVHKPLLLLTRETQQFNEFGEKLKKILYCCPGNSFDRIEAFLNDVIINENDVMKSKRDAFFEENLDYYNLNNGQLATEYIFNYLNSVFMKDEEKNNEGK